MINDSLRQYDYGFFQDYSSSVMLRTLLFGVVMFLFICSAESRCRVSKCGIPPSGRHSVPALNSTAMKTYYECKPGYKYNSGDALVSCHSNGSWVGTAMTCEDAYNCYNSTAPCMNGGICNELSPSFECSCVRSYYGSLCDEADGSWGAWMSWTNCSSTCDEGILVRRRMCDNPKPTTKGRMCFGSAMEIDECTTADCPEGMYQWCGNDTNRCGQQSGYAFCSIYNGAYRCDCLEGVTAKRDRRGNFVQCEDIDECTNRLHTCHPSYQRCVNTYGSYNCICRAGFTPYDESSCTDINECQTGTHNCDENARCINNEGGYSCNCKTGYRSLAVNGTGFVGECKESRLVHYGSSAEDRQVTSLSSSTGERVTDILGIPSGIPLEDSDGNTKHCRSVYATENGLVIITTIPEGGNHPRKSSFRNPSNITSLAMMSEGEFPNHICAIVSPLWTDAFDASRGRMWYQLYDMKEFSLNELSLYASEYSVTDHIATFLPGDFEPRYVFKVTWEGIPPPWPSEHEEMTFQSLIATDGARTFIVNLYEDGVMTWRPVYDVPVELPFYQAVSGYFVNGVTPTWWQHNSSGEWTEREESNSKPTVYRLDEIVFNSTSQLGKDVHDLTPNRSPSNPNDGLICYEWYLRQNDITRFVYDVINSCPDNEAAFSNMGLVSWRKLDHENGNTTCYAWNFQFNTGGSFDCCYESTLNGRGSIIAGINAFSVGAGFYYVNRTEDTIIRRSCCRNTRSNYFCGLYSSKRPPSSSKGYHPTIVRGSGNGLTVSASGKRRQIQGIGELQLLRHEEDNQDRVNLIGRLERIGQTASRFTALAVRLDNVTFEFYLPDSTTTRIDCYVDDMDCEDMTYDDDIKFETTASSVALATRNGHFVNVSYSGVGNGLSFFASFDGRSFSNDLNATSGILSSSGKCFGAKPITGNPQLEIPCDLKSIANGLNRPVETESFFSHYPVGVNVTSYLSSMSLGLSDVSSTGQSLTHQTQTTARLNNDATAHVTATKVDAGYDVTINVTDILGDVTSHFDSLATREEGIIRFTTDNLTSVENMRLTVTSPNSDTSIIFPNVTLCHCDHGTCISQPDTALGGPFVNQAACQCELGFEGERCEERVRPCSENPCFYDVECREIQPFAARSGDVAKWYECGPCPESLPVGNGETCYHDNPCLKPQGSERSHECVNATCRHQVYGYSCSCFDGFRKIEGEERVCEDIDECAEGLDCNDTAAECINTPGGYSCSCRVGYKLEEESSHCLDDNECLNDNGGCERRCVNTEGSFYCHCEVGYQLSADNRSCDEINECNEYAQQHCSQICDDSRPGLPFQCLCLDNYELEEDYSSCRRLFSTAASTTAQTSVGLVTSKVASTSTILFRDHDDRVVTTTSRPQFRIQTTTQRVAATTLMTTSRTTSQSTTFVMSLHGFDEISNELMSDGGFRTLSAQQKVKAQLAVERTLQLLSNDAILRLIILLSRIGVFGSESQVCSALYSSATYENIAVYSLPLDGIREIADLELNVKILKFKLDLNKIASNPIQSTQSMKMQLSEIKNYLTYILRCAALWSWYRSATTESQPLLARREATGSDITSSPSPKRGLKFGKVIPPMVIVWIIVVVCFVTIMAFVCFILGMRCCFAGKTKNREEIARMKKNKKLEQWPRIVISQEI